MKLLMETYAMIHELSDNCLFVAMPQCRVLGEVLENINTIINNDPTSDVIIDFSGVELLKSSDLANLMILRGMLSKHGHRLILCDIPLQIKCEFTVTGLRELFDFATDKHAAVTAQGSAYKSD